MSQPNDPQHDELRDRLIDQALREVLGGEAPPDLSDKILAAAEKQRVVSSQRKEHGMDRSRRGYRLWILGAVAACLLAAVAVTMMQFSVRHVRRTAHRIGNEEAPGAGAAPRSDSAPSPPAPAEGSSSDYDSLEGLLETSGEKNAPKDEISSLRQATDSEEDEASVERKALRQPPGKSIADDRYRALSKEAQSQPFPEPNAAPPASAANRPAADASDYRRADWESKPKEDLWNDSTSGRGPGRAGDRYDRLVENPFRTVKDHPLSTFSIDVDTASYANVRRFLLREGRMPPPDAVRIEELVNYFDYEYEGPEGDAPFAARIEVAGCPWKAGHRLVRVALKGKEIDNEERPPSNLVFLLDVSGSMNSPDKLPLLKEGMKLLAEQMREQDRVAIVVYASAEGLALPSTPGSRREEIVAALDRLQAGGSTAGGAGIQLAYRIAQENFIEGGVNRVLLCTDGDFNVGATSTATLQRTVEEKARSGVFLSVLGFGRGNLNDAMMETISNKGNGNYAYIDSITEARKVLVQQMGGTLVTIAKDVKIQIEFNPAQAAGYRLIGYENRILAAEDFNDDKKDAGEIGAGHTVTALYEVVPAGGQVDAPSVDPLKYQNRSKESDDESVGGELLTLKLRYKAPDGDTSKLLEFPVADAGESFGRASRDFQFAAAVASFGMLLRDSEHKGSATYDAVLEIAGAAQGADAHGYRAELLEMVRRAKALDDR